VVDVFLTSPSEVLLRDDDDLQNAKAISELDERHDTLRLRRVYEGNRDVHNRQNSHRKTFEEMGMSGEWAGRGTADTLGALRDGLSTNDR
jgi:hypothetical protein